MFVTDPTPSEYQLYVMAKAAREAREEEAAVKAKMAQMRAADAAAGEAPAGQDSAQPPR
jgi:hypothetical protein